MEYDLKYLDGFKCDEFIISDGYYLGKYFLEKQKIGYIRKIQGRCVVIKHYDEKNQLPIKILLYGSVYEKEIIENMTQYQIYNKRKSIIENL